MSKKYFNIIFLILVLCAIVLLSDETVSVMKNIFLRTSKEVITSNQPVVVIDPGHGGRDPGKIGVNNALEKDINLAIALELKELLELNDITVVMTRESDIGLYSENDKNRKSADLKKRVSIVNGNNALLTVSIHQNSFPDASVEGAQVFYYSNSKEGKDLANKLQESISSEISDGNQRKAKANQSYYMLKKATCPIVIVECGFLSNQKEAKLLVEEEYQRKMAWAIHMGIMQYCNTK